jgi:class 3 adenylate cyclase/tetratricopeptide (TPR) repeat protein
MLRLMRCAACGTDSPADFRFCGSCGASLEGAEPAREVRKVVTIVFCDLTGSTALGDAVDPEALRATMRGYYEEMRTILVRHGGTVEKFIGDAVMAVFGVPVAHEDDALRAVRAAWEMRAAVPALGLKARIGVNTGEVVAGEGDSLVTGDAVNVAARLEQAADPGDVLIGGDTRRLVRDAVRVEPVEVAAKGKPEPVAAFRLLDVDPEADAIARRLDTPLIGRGTELEQLRQAFERTVREQRCHLFTLLGPAGAGKSRLVGELLDGLDATVLHGRCLDYGDGITFWPVISVLKQLGERGNATVSRIVEGASSPNELFWTVRSQLEEVALERPLVVCFDDIQWGEQTFLDLVDHIADLSRGAPILLLCVARPELLDRRPGWSGGKLNATMLLLAPLSGSECAELIEAHGGVDEALRERILDAADGNPLFLEEMVALVHEGGDVRVPSSVQALLQARLDQLDSAERQVMERGSVEGQIFHRNAVLDLTRWADVEAQLAGLVRKELIHPAQATFSGDHAFRFRHLLIRDAAYDALPKETRADLHEQFAGWLAEHGEELIELDEVVGYHLEQSAGYKRELGRPDAEIERAAGLRLAEAGARASGRSDAHGAANLLGRAVALLPESDQARATALVNRIAMLEQAADPDRDAAISQLETSEDPRLREHGRLARLQLRLMTEPVAVTEEAERAVDEAVALFTETGDDLGLVQAYYLLSWTSWMRSLAVPTAAALERLIEHAGRAGAKVQADQSELRYMGALEHGPFPVDEIREHLERLALVDTPLARASVLMFSSALAARGGRFTEALEGVEAAAAIQRELGLEIGAAICAGQHAEYLAEAGRLDESADAFAAVIGRMRELGQTAFLSTMLIELGDILYRRGEPAEAERLAIEGEELGAAEDVVNFAWGRLVRAKAAADRGALDEAERLARDAVRFAYETDFPRVHASAHSALAHVLHAAGRLEEARAELERELALWERYGFDVRAGHTRGLLAEL